MSAQLFQPDDLNNKEKERYESVLEELKKAGLYGLTINECSLKTKMMRATADKYLNHILDSGSVVLIQKGPSKIFLHKESAFLQLERILGKKKPTSIRLISRNQIQQIKKFSAAIGLSPEEFSEKAILEFIRIQKMKLKAEATI